MNLNSVFDPNNAFFSGISRLVDVVGVSVLWLFCCLPMITIGPATCALYLTSLRCVRQGKGHTYRHFFGSFRENLKVGVLSTLVCLPFALVFQFGFPWLIYLASQGDRVAELCYYLWKFLSVVLLAVPCVLFPILSRFRMGMKQLWSNGVRFILAHLPSALVLSLLAQVSAEFSVRYLAPLLFMPVVCAVIFSWFLEKYLVPLENLEGEKEKTEEKASS